MSNNDHRSPPSQRAFLAPLIAQKLEHRRLLEGLAAARVVPSEHPGLAAAWACLLSLDQMGCALAQAGPDSDPASVGTVEEYLASCRTVREDLLESLPPSLRLRVMSAATQTEVTEADAEAQLLAEWESPEEAATALSHGMNLLGLEDLIGALDRPAASSRTARSPRIQTNESTNRRPSRCHFRSSRRTG